MPHTNEYRDRRVQTSSNNSKYVTLTTYNAPNTFFTQPCEPPQNKPFVLVNNKRMGYDTLTSSSGRTYDSVNQAYSSQCDSYMMRPCTGFN